MCSSRPRPDRLELVGDLAAAGQEVVVGLQLQEETLRHAEVAGEAQVGVGRDGALAEHDLVDAPRRDLDGLCERRLRQRHRLQELYHQDVARMGVDERA